MHGGGDELQWHRIGVLMRVGVFWIRISELLRDGIGLGGFCIRSSEMLRDWLGLGGFWI